MGRLVQNTAKNRMVFLVDETDHVTGLPGLTLAIEVSKDGGAFASISPTVTDRGDGWYNLALTSSHTDTPGDLAFHIEATGADPLDFKDEVEADPFNAIIPDSLPAANTRPTLLQAALGLWRVYYTKREAVDLLLTFYKENQVDASTTHLMNHPDTPREIHRV